MTQSPVGLPVAALDTPALVVDLDTLDHNIAVMSALLAEHGVGWRPHAKAHKSPAVAHRLLAAGAIGITCAKLSEAEVYAASGIRDILVANQVVGPIKTRRLAHLAREIDIIRMIAKGLRNKEIADKLFIGEGTVKVHLHHIYEKLGIDGRLALLRLAHDRGLV